jgi:protein-ribulosamine 3-kinase
MADDTAAGNASLTGIAQAIGAALGADVEAQPAARVHGGCISESFRWSSEQGPLFVKVGGADSREAFEAEAAGLSELGAADAVRVPGVLVTGVTATHAFLALEWLDLRAGDGASEARLGEQLAFQHRSGAATFGWSRDNTIGSTPQQNAPSSDWAAFFRERRLRFQLELARDNGHDGGLQTRGSLLLELMPAFFSSYRPVPSLLHGDLWGGNFAATTDGVPVIFDPAVYYGDREADIAMTRLFAGFGHSFYTAYQAAWPLDQAAGTRRTLYNLYHVLNHLNLFGGAYAEQARAMIDRLLAELGH